MRALIAMAVHDTPENLRHKYTFATLDSMIKQGVHKRHDLFVINNGNSQKTLDYLKIVQDIHHEITVLYNTKNVGTARAINQAWKHRKPDQYAIKMDNDVIIYRNDWVEQMVDAMKRMPEIGILGLKRKDCWENPDHEDKYYKSELVMTPHEPGHKWIVIEKVNHVIGTCQMYSPALLEKIGYMYQPTLYGWDDVIAAYKCRAAGFINAFLPHIEIDHIDEGGGEYQGWKHRESGKVQQDVIKYCHEILDWSIIQSKLKNSIETYNKYQGEDTVKNRLGMMVKEWEKHAADYVAQGRTVNELYQKYY